MINVTFTIEYTSELQLMLEEIAELGIKVIAAIEHPNSIIDLTIQGDRDSIEQLDYNWGIL